MFCKKLKGQKYCTNQEPQMNAILIIKKQLNALKKNDVNNSGIKVAYQFASPSNKQFTGPYPNFVNMLKNNSYKHLLNHTKYQIIYHKSYNNDMNYKAIIKVFKNKNVYKYIFELSRQYDFKNNKPLYDDLTEIGLGHTDLKLYWRTDRVILESNKKAKNINNKALQICSTNPMTGYFRDGYCHTDETDSGTHVVCAKVNKNFLDYTKKKGNDLSTPNSNFQGLKPGDNWCLCALRWNETYEVGKAPPVNLQATNLQATDFNIEKRLREFSL
jgi:uncharacterized protein